MPIFGLPRLLPTTLWGKSPCEVAEESVFRRLQKHHFCGHPAKQSPVMPSALEFFATAQSFRENAHLRASTESQIRNISTVGAKRSHCAEYCSIQPQRWRLFVMSQRNVCYIVFHRDTEPKSIAAEKEIVRDVTEKRLLHRIFIATQSPNRFHELQTVHFHCWLQTLPLSGVLFHPASVKEFVRDHRQEKVMCGWSCMDVS